ncbi:MAG: putative toxin-antitoxin system toxin component, PIN family [Nitrososphaerales archaeon]
MENPESWFANLLKDTPFSPQKLLAELLDVLSREKFNSIGQSQVNEFLSIILEATHKVNVRSVPKVIEKDPDDNKVLGVALEGEAEYVVTGDGHLLALGEFRGIAIVRVGQMLELIRKE